MTAPDIAKVIEGVLRDHYWSTIRTSCACRWKPVAEFGADLLGMHAAHQAAEVSAALAPILAEQRAEAWEQGVDAAVEATFQELKTGKAIPPVNPYRARADAVKGERV